MAGVVSIRALLSERILHLYALDDEFGIFDQVDAFVNLSRDNETVQEVILYPVTDPSDDASRTHRYAISWDKIAEGIGNLQALRKITIWDASFEEAPLVPDWKILARILRRLTDRRGIQLDMADNATPWDIERDPESLLLFTAVIHGQAMITEFITGNSFPFDCLDMLCSTLLTLPALESVTFQHTNGQGPQEGQSLESMVQLLRSPTLRQVAFHHVSFSNTLSQAVAKALTERSEITYLTFYDCSFAEDGGTAIATALTTNTTLKSLKFDASTLVDGKVFYDALTTVLLSNSTLQELAFDMAESYATAIRMDFLAALHKNESLESLSMISENTSFKDYLVCIAAIHPNTTMKRLRLHPLHGVDLCADQDETKDLITVLKKNYGLEEIPGLQHDSAGDIRCILQLNAAGRRYLVQDGSSVSKGVDVLGGVSNDINSVFLHLLENPRLCDRSAVEISDRSSNPMNHSGDSDGGK
jgi:hypothetical protein